MVVRRELAAAMAWRGCWLLLLLLPLLLLGGARAGPPACAAGARCRLQGVAMDEYTYKVDDETLSISFRDSGYVSVTCGPTATLDSPSLPRFADEARVSTVLFRDCPAPDASYARVLRALNVAALSKLELLRSREPLRRAHLAGLRVASLVLVRLRLGADALDGLDATGLLLDSVNATGALLERLPASLQHLHLVNMGVRELRRAQLERFPALRRLIVRDEGELRVEAAGALAELALDAERVWLAPALGERLAKLTVYNWAERAPAPWTRCAALDRLDIHGAEALALPDGWLAACGALRELSVRGAAGLAALSSSGAPGAHALRGATALENVTLSQCALAALPSGLLDDAERLLRLNLSGNRLRELPSGLFGKTRRLLALDLSRNALAPGAFARLEALTSLRELRLARNPRLGDACAVPSGISSLKDMKNLEELDLSGTGAANICRDFMENMFHLKNLNLSKNNFTHLKFADVQFRAAVTVDLRANNLTQLRYSRAEFRLLMAHRASYCSPGAPLASPAAFRLPPLRCDCAALWAALALRRCPAHARLDATCGAGRALAAEPLDALTCASAACRAPAPCRCAERADGPDAPGEGRVLRVDCAGAELRAPPRLARVRGARWQLALANNSIAALRRADLPPDLMSLDLRHNKLQALEPDVLAALPADGALWLGGNALACDCAHERALAALLARRALVRDWPALRCAGGGPLELPRCGASAGALLGALLAPLALLALLLGGALARRDVRARLKAALRRAGLLAAAREEDDGRPYDVFVSFSHADGAVAERLLAELEPRYRVCVHWRDWAPGAWIPAQIAASVARSRRTLALVSAHYLRSAWARAEFREAHGAALRDAAPRLVVVLLDEPGALALDAELRRYLAANTYVRWGDRWFWQKLRAALPRPRAPAPLGEPLELPPAPHAPSAA